MSKLYNHNFLEYDKTLATLYYGFGNATETLANYRQISKDIVTIPAITGPNNTIFKAQHCSMSKEMDKLRETYSKRDRKAETSEGVVYDLISEQLDCDKSTNKYLQVKQVPQCLAEMSDKVVLTLLNSSKDDEFYKNLRKQTKYTAKSGLQSTYNYYSTFGIDFKSIFIETVNKYFSKYDWLPAPSTKIIDQVAKDAITRFKQYLNDKVKLKYNDLGYAIFANKYQSSFRQIGYTFSANEAKPMIAYSKNWQIMIWVKHPLCKTKKGTKPVIYLPANLHTHYLDLHQLMNTPEARLETVSKCYFKIYTNSALPCLLYNKAHTNLIPIKTKLGNAVQYKNPESVAAVFPEIDEENKTIRLVIAYTDDISKQQISYLNITKYLPKITSLWRKLTMIKSEGTKTRKQGGTAYIHTGQEYSNIRFAIQNAFVNELRENLPENIGRILVMDASEDSFKNTNSSLKPEALYSLGFSFKNKEGNKVYKYKPFVIIHDELIKALARTCRDRGILMSAVPIFNVQKTCHVCGYPVPVNGRAICPACATGTIIEVQSSQRLDDIHPQMKSCLSTEYQFGNFTASNLLFSIVDRKYQTPVLPGEDWTESSLLSKMADSEIAISKFIECYPSISKVEVSTSSNLKIENPNAIKKFSNRFITPDGYFKLKNEKLESCQDSVQELVNATAPESLEEEDTSIDGRIQYLESNIDKILKHHIEFFESTDYNISSDWFNSIDKYQSEYTCTTSDLYYKQARNSYKNVGKVLESQKQFKLVRNKSLLDSRNLYSQDYKFSKDHKVVSSLDSYKSALEYTDVDSKLYNSLYLVDDTSQAYDLSNSLTKAFSIALSVNLKLETEVVKLHELDFQDFKINAKYLINLAKDIASTLNLSKSYVLNFKELYDDIKILNTYNSDDTQIFALKILNDLHEVDLNFQELIMHKVDCFIIAMYIFNDKYKELLEKSYTGIIDYDDCISASFNTGRLFELMQKEDIESAIKDKTKYYYKTRFYTNLKSLGIFYQYLYGIIQITESFSLKSKMSNNVIDDMFKDRKYIKDIASGYHEDPSNQICWFNSYAIVGSDIENREYIEPINSHTIFLQTFRSDSNVAFEPSYWRTLSYKTLQMGNTVQLMPNPKTYCIQGYLNDRISKNLNNHKFPRTYEYDYSQELAITNFNTAAVVHPIHRYLTNMKYDCFNRLALREQGFSKEYEYFTDIIKNAFKNNKLKFDYIQSSKLSKERLDYFIKTNLLDTYANTKYSTEILYGIELLEHIGVGDTHFNYVNNYMNLDLAISEFQGIEHPGRSLIFVDNEQNIIHPFIEHVNCHRLGPYKMINSNAYSTVCASILRWLRVPFNTLNLLKNQEAFREAIIRIYKLSDKSNADCKKRYWRTDLMPMQILEKIGINSVILDFNDLYNQDVKNLLISLAYAPMRYFFECIRTESSKLYLNKPNGKSDSSNLSYTKEIKIPDYTTKAFINKINGLLNKRFRTISKVQLSKQEKQEYRKRINRYEYWPDLTCKLDHWLNDHKNCLDYTKLYATILDIEAESTRRFIELDKIRVSYMKTEPELVPGLNQIAKIAYADRFKKSTGIDVLSILSYNKYRKLKREYIKARKAGRI